MTIDGDVLELELDDDLEAVSELKEFVKDRLEYIDEIVIVGDTSTFTTSAMFQILMSIKKSKPEMKIPLLDNESLELGNYGKLYWIK